MVARYLPHILIGLAALQVSASLTLSHAQTFDLYIGYELPKNRDLAAQAAGQEAKCLAARNVGLQACMRDVVECGNNAEIAFRRCISSIPLVRFLLAICEKDQNCPRVTSVFPLSRDNAVDPDLNPSLPHLRSAGRYSPVGIYVQVSRHNSTPYGRDETACRFLNARDKSAANVPNPNQLCGAIGIKVANGSSSPVLGTAIEMRQEDLVRLLLDRDWPVDFIALQTAVNTKQLSMLTLLLDHGADINEWGNWLEQVDWPQETSVIEYVSRRFTVLFAAASDAGSTGRSPGYAPVIEFLLSHGADVNLTDEDGTTPLHDAVSGTRQDDDQIDAVRILLAHGADLNAKGRGGMTPLHVAAIRGNLRIVKFLVLQGADINVKDNRGRTAVDLAEAERHSDVVNYLRDQKDRK